MNVTEALEQLLRQNNKKKVWVAEVLSKYKDGGVGQTAVSNMLRRGNVTMSTLLKICNELDYEITIQPKRRQGSRPANQIVIDSAGKVEPK